MNELTVKIAVPSPIRFVFFGSSRFSVIILGELEKSGLNPAVIITTPDRPQGRKMEMTPTEVKKWANKRNIPVYSPENLNDVFLAQIKNDLSDLFIVASYGKILPEKVINFPKLKTLNVHPSLLPKYRGASPLEFAMIDDAKNTGVVIIRMDEKMDHGPIIAKKEVYVKEWPIYERLETLMAVEGAKLLVELLPKWVTGKVPEIEQNHSAATFTKKITKENALLDLSADPYLNFRKIQAYHEWPQAYFLIEKNAKMVRVKITSASFSAGKLSIRKVIPEGAREMNYTDFQIGYGIKK